jgi:putative serine protease PepD
MWLQVRSGPDAGSAVELPEDRAFVLGRQRGSDLVVRDAQASRRHAELEPLPNFKWRLTDLESANGTLVDGGPVTEVILEGGEEIKIGDVLIAVTTAPPFERQPEPAPAGTKRTPAGRTDMPALATQSMVKRLVDAGTRRASRTAVLVGGGALVAVTVVVILLVTGTLSGDDEDAVPKVVAKVSPSTALIATSLDGRATGTGSGWVLDAGAGLVVTNAHVINQGDTFRVTTGGRSQEASVVGVSPCEDLALLRVADHGGLTTAALASGGSVKQGETVVALGFPADALAGDSPGSTRGVVSNVKTAFKDPAPDVPAYPEVLQTDTPLNPGNSGGPLVDLDARVVGVDSAARTTGSDGRPLQNVNYAIGIDRARGVLSDIQAGRSAGWTGLTFEYPTDDDLAREDLPPGLSVAGVIAGTPAAAAGVKAGDFLAGIDGTPIANTLASYCEVIGDRRAGDEVILNLAEPGESETRRVTVKLAG